MINVVVDLSHHNTISSFNDVKASGIAGVIHKATQGTGYQDPTYQSRKIDALAAGLLWGAYHFGTDSDPIQQAEYFLSFVKPGQSDLLVLDLEENPGGGSMTLAQAEQFVTHIQSATGRWPGLYGGSYVKQLVGSTPHPTLANCWFWLAQYGSNPVVPSAVWSAWTMWQYTDGTSGSEPHSVNGIGNCDRDQFNGSMEELTQLWNQAPAFAKENSLYHPAIDSNNRPLGALQCKNGNRLDIYDTRVFSMVLDKLA